MQKVVHSPRNTRSLTKRKRMTNTEAETTNENTIERIVQQREAEINQTVSNPPSTSNAVTIQPHVPLQFTASNFAHQISSTSYAIPSSNPQQTTISSNFLNTSQATTSLTSISSTITPNSSQQSNNSTITTTSSQSLVPSTTNSSQQYPISTTTQHYPTDIPNSTWSPNQLPQSQFSYSNISPPSTHLYPPCFYNQQSSSNPSVSQNYAYPANTYQLIPNQYYNPYQNINQFPMMNSQPWIQLQSTSTPIQNQIPIPSSNSIPPIQSQLPTSSTNIIPPAQLTHAISNPISISNQVTSYLPNQVQYQSFPSNTNNSSQLTTPISNQTFLPPSNPIMMNIPQNNYKKSIHYQNLMVMLINGHSSFHNSMNPPKIINIRIWKIPLDFIQH